MLTRSVRSLVVVLGLGASAWAAEARADEAEPIRLVYSAPTECPREVDFVTQLHARTLRAHLVVNGEQEHRTFEVAIRAESADRFGSRVVIRHRTRTSTRTISGERCAAVAAASALIVALAIDPAASTRPIGDLLPSDEPAEATCMPNQVEGIGEIGD